MKKHLTLASALCAIICAGVVFYCADPEFNNPLDPRNNNPRWDGGGGNPVTPPQDQETVIGSCTVHGFCTNDVRQSACPSSAIFVQGGQCQGADPTCTPWVGIGCPTDQGFCGADCVVSLRANCGTTFSQSLPASCGYNPEPMGSCTIGSTCTDNVWQSQCVTNGGTFTVSATCPITSPNQVTFYCPSNGCVLVQGTTMPSNCFPTLPACQAAMPPQSTTGTCHFPDGSCFMSIVDVQCLSAGGTFLAGAATCPTEPVNTYWCGPACVLQSTDYNPPCFTTQAECQAYFGTQPPTDVMGACMMGSTCYDNMWQSSCSASGGAFMPNTTCPIGSTNHPYCCWATGGHVAECHPIDWEQPQFGGVATDDQCIANNGMPSDSSGVIIIGVCGWQWGDPWSCVAVMQGQMNMDYGMTQEDACNMYGARWFPGDIDIEANCSSLMSNNPSTGCFWGYQPLYNDGAHCWMNYTPAECTELMGTPVPTCAPLCNQCPQAGGSQACYDYYSTDGCWMVGGPEFMP